MKNIVLLIFPVFLSLVGVAAALQPDQLTASELQTYERIKNDPDARERFLTTREYYRLCLWAVVEKDSSVRELRVKDLPVKRPAGFDEAFVTVEERNAVLKAEVLKGLHELIFGDKP